jgi:hypothetical protein
LLENNKRYYPSVKWGYIIAGLLVIANVINLGALSSRNGLLH